MKLPNGYTDSNYIAAVRREPIKMRREWSIILVDDTEVILFYCADCELEGATLGDGAMTNEKMWTYNLRRVYARPNNF